MTGLTCPNLRNRHSPTQRHYLFDTRRKDARAEVVRIPDDEPRGRDLLRDLDAVRFERSSDRPLEVRDRFVQIGLRLQLFPAGVDQVFLALKHEKNRRRTRLELPFLTLEKLLRRRPRRRRGLESRLRRTQRLQSVADIGFDRLFDLRRLRFDLTSLDERPSEICARDAVSERQRDRQADAIRRIVLLD